nr:neuropeptide CCHamide-1-like [Cherax quadricarinatus]
MGSLYHLSYSSSFCLILLCSSGSCSQFGHSCFGAHGKRDGEQQYVQQQVDAAALYPGETQLQEQLDGRSDLPLPLQDMPDAFTNREIVANVRNWLAVLSRRLRQRSSQLSSSTQSNGYFQ